MSTLQHSHATVCGMARRCSVCGGRPVDVSWLAHKAALVCSACLPAGPRSPHPLHAVIAAATARLPATPSPPSWLRSCSVLVDIYSLVDHGTGAGTRSGSRRYVMVLTDYGVAGCATVCAPSMHTRTGTPGWSPPEYHKPTAGYTNSWDTWGLGLLCLQLNTGRQPTADDEKEYQVLGQSCYMRAALPRPALPFHAMPVPTSQSASQLASRVCMCLPIVW